MAVLDHNAASKSCTYIQNAGEDTSKINEKTDHQLNGESDIFFVDWFLLNAANMLSINH